MPLSQDKTNSSSACELLGPAEAAWEQLFEALADAIANAVIADFSRQSTGRGADGPLPGGASGPNRHCPERREDGKRRER